MNVSVVASGYVGTTTAACLAELDHEVSAIGVDEGVVERIDAGETPIYEPEPKDLLATRSGNRPRATTDYGVIRSPGVTFLALSASTDGNGHMDLDVTNAGTEGVGDGLCEESDEHLVYESLTW